MGDSRALHWRGRRVCRCAGITIVEVVVGIVLFTITLVGLGSMLVSNRQSQEMAAEEALVSHSFRRMVETIRSTPFSEIASTYQGFSFTVPEIEATGTVQLFLNETGGSADAAKLGLPRDLDGDGLPTSTDVSASYELLPVKIQISWTSFYGPQNRDLYLLLTREE